MLQRKIEVSNLELLSTTFVSIETFSSRIVRQVQPLHRLSSASLMEVVQFDHHRRPAPFLSMFSLEVASSFWRLMVEENFEATPAFQPRPAIF